MSLPISVFVVHHSLVFHLMFHENRPAFRDEVHARAQSGARFGGVALPVGRAQGPMRSSTLRGRPATTAPRVSSNSRGP